MNKILCTGAPRSGTSMFNLLMSYFKELSVYQNGTPPHLFEQCDVFTTQQRPDGKLWNDFISPTSLYQALEAGIKVIVIYRDGRDCLISSRKGHDGYWYGPELEHVEKWFNSVEELINTQKQVKDTELEKLLHVVRYESLVENPSVVMADVEKFVASPLDKTYTEFYKDYSNTRNMATEGAVGSEHSTLRPLESNSLNWKKEKHDARMKEIINAYGDRFGELLIALGYESDKEWLNDYR